MCACSDIQPLRHKICIASMAQWYSVSFIPGVAGVQAQANTIYLNLGFLHDKMNMKYEI
jgi:hypothetical protein